MRELKELFAALARSRFRSSFHLRRKEWQYLHDKGLPTVMQHARDFIGKRLQPAIIANDGKQTPYTGHPVFVAQHATATCCRSCLEKWHGIRAGRALDEAQCAYIYQVLEVWLQHQLRT